MMTLKPFRRKMYSVPAYNIQILQNLEYFGNNFSFQGQQYAIIGNLKTSGKVVDDPNCTVYGEIQHVHSSQQVQITDTSSQTRNTTQLTQGTYQAF